MFRNICDFAHILITGTLPDGNMDLSCGEHMLLKGAAFSMK